MGLTTSRDREIEMLQQALLNREVAQAQNLFQQIARRRQTEPAVLHRLAILAYQAGQLHAAGQLLDRVTQLAPNCAAYWNDLGVVLHAGGFHDRAIQACRRAIEFQADYVEGYYNLGNALSGARRLDEAIDAYQKALSLRPEYGGALNNLGNALRASGRNSEALQCLGKLVEIQPRDAQAINNLGVSLEAAGQIDEAFGSYQKAIELQPDFPEAHNNLGNLLRGRGDLECAINAFQRAIALRPQYAEAYNNLGHAFTTAGHTQEAIASCQRAVTLDPTLVAGHNNLGLAFEEAGETEAALDCFRHAMQLKPHAIGSKLNFGRLIGESGRLDEGIAICREVVQAAPAAFEPHCNLAYLLLMKGDFEEEWREHEERLKDVSLRRYFTSSQPHWHGEDLNGRAIFIHPEQGMGDMIQFSRYVPQVARRGGTVIAAFPAPLFEFMRHLLGTVRVIRVEDPLPEFDYHCSLLSLPFALGCRDPIPPVLPEIPESPDKPRGQPIHAVAATAPLRIGLCWAGAPLPRNRSMPLHQLQPLAKTRATFDSLQVGPAAAQVHQQNSWTVIDHSSQLHSFADTAALIRQLDLVVTVDTAVAHLAGTLGVPTFVLLPYLAGWRWMQRRSDSPWYPSMRLFRQRRQGDWSAPVSDIVQAIKDLD